MRALRDGKFPYRAAVALAALNGGIAHAQPPVHALVTGDDDALTTALAERLTASGHYALTTGVLPDCGERTACWRTALAGRGLDQAIFVDRVDVDVVGVRVIDADGLLRRATTTLAEPADSPPIDALFFGPGTLHLSGAPPGARAIVDGHLALRVDGEAWIRDLPSGKHAIELSADGRAPRFIAVMLPPGGAVEVDAGLEAPFRVRKAFPTAATLCLAVIGGGALAIASSWDAPGVARRVP